MSYDDLSGLWSALDWDARNAVTERLLGVYLQHQADSITVYLRRQEVAPLPGPPVTIHYFRAVFFAGSLVGYKGGTACPSLDVAMELARFIVEQQSGTHDHDATVDARIVLVAGAIEEAAR